jgi:hypothetical protein
MIRGKSASQAIDILTVGGHCATPIHKWGSAFGDLSLYGDAGPFASPFDRG